jgi:hypothetical protein
MSRAVVRPMILTAFEGSCGEIERRLLLRDARVPRPFSLDQPPRLLGSYDRNKQCPDGRHLWDAIVANGECRYDEDEYEHLPFRLTLTCVRCGRLERLAGVTDEEHCHAGGRVPPEPIAAGGLSAQQVTEARSLISEWHVFDRDRQRIGFMAAGVTRRGRHYVAGRLERRDDSVEAPTALACLRKLAKVSGDAG